MTIKTTPRYGFQYIDDTEPLKNLPSVTENIARRLEAAMTDAAIPPGNPDINDVLLRLRKLETIRFGHMGRTAGFQELSADRSQLVHMTAAQDLLGGVGFDPTTSALVVPVTGRWNINCRFYATGRAGIQASGQATIRRGSTTMDLDGTAASFWKADHHDYINQSSVTQHLVAGDKIFLQMQYGGSTWGTTGYNGSSLEIRYVGPSGSS